MLIIWRHLHLVIRVIITKVKTNQKTVIHYSFCFQELTISIYLSEEDRKSVMIKAKLASDGGGMRKVYMCGRERESII